MLPGRPARSKSDSMVLGQSGARARLTPDGECPNHQVETNGRGFKEHSNALPPRRDMSN